MAAAVAAVVENKSFFLLFALTIFTSASYANLEFRGFGGMTYSNPKTYNEYLLQNNIKPLNFMKATGADFLVNAGRRNSTLMGFGARIESLETRLTAIDPVVDNSANILLKHSSLLFFAREYKGSGPIKFWKELNVTVGGDTVADIVYNISGTTFTVKNATPRDWSVGVGLGLSAKVVVLGVEIGYRDYILNNIVASTGAQDYNIVLSGYYARASIGLSLFDVFDISDQFTSGKSSSNRKK